MDLKKISQIGFEELWRAHEPACGFTSYIALHNLSRGPALGGVRLWQYSGEDDAVDDALRLARAMTYKAAVADLPHGGGKAVILQPKAPFDRSAYLECFAEFINHLDGRYITAKDVGTSTEDMTAIKQHTRWVTGYAVEQGGAGDPSPLTAYGVFLGIQVVAEAGLGRKNLRGARVLIQGLGGVGEALARHLVQAGCEIWACDLQAARLLQLCNELGLHGLLPEAALEQEVEIFSPCALGRVLNRETLSKLKAKAVAGGANDQLTDEEIDSKKLKERGILYAPDFVINAGGLIHVAGEWAGYNADQSRKKVEHIGETLRNIFHQAKQDDLTPLEAALRLAESRF